MASLALWHPPFAVFRAEEMKNMEERRREWGALACQCRRSRLLEAFFWEGVRGEHSLGCIPCVVRAQSFLPWRRPFNSCRAVDRTAGLIG
jgi:hypothetical protein